MYIADLHIHSRYSRATSRDLTPERLELGARQKGIRLLGTGDFTHPAWRKELWKKLIPAEDGLYRLREEDVLEKGVESEENRTRFVVTGEISSIYKQEGKTRKVHSLILLPGLDAADQLAAKLEEIGNIHSDGRPILGLSCHDLLEIMLDICPEGIFVPAHIWTPHFSMFGACSGFGSVEECFGDLSPYIHAVETGLSSDPPMNWQLSSLDRFQLISNSDAHSPAKLGREANLLRGPLSYEGLKKALETGEGLEGTIEFFPEEGKYHYDGHRKCHICLEPEEAVKYGGICPVCGKKLTMGVSHRILELADRPQGYLPENRKAFESLVPLAEVIAASTGRSAASKKVQEEYFRMVRTLGNEFFILRELPLEEIRNQAGSRIAEGIRRLREGQVKRIPGFDGEYGTIQLFDADELANMEGQMSFGGLFDAKADAVREEKTKTETSPDRAKEAETLEPSGDFAAQPQEDTSMAGAAREENASDKTADFLSRLNPEQRLAAEQAARFMAVIAGPGTGKTGTLAARIRCLIEKRKVKASEITAVTFTNQAAKELRERLKREMPHRRAASLVQAGTFHSLCLKLLQKAGKNISLADEETKLFLAESILKEQDAKLSPSAFLSMVSREKLHRAMEEEQKQADIYEKNPEFEAACAAYGKRMEEEGLWDFDDLLIETKRLLDCSEDQDAGLCRQFRYLLVDEFQDIDALQYQLICQWNRNGRELFVIGDPDQSIYGFRGADPACFSRMLLDFPQTEVIRLKENYRSTSEILSASAELIGHNPGGDRSLHAAKGAGLPVRIVEASGKQGEGIFAAREINRMIGGIDMLDAQEKGYQDTAGGRSFSEIAVLVRTNRQAEAMEEYLKTEGIPYVVRGRGTFLEAQTVREALAYFRKSGEAEGLRRKKPAVLLQSWMQEKGLAGDEPLQKLWNMAVCYKTMDAFLNMLELGEEGDLCRSGTRHYTADAVSLMTLHASKGLEFSAVIIPWVNRYSIPMESRKEEALQSLEEERRLLYVGMTRAKEELILVTSGEPSAFLSEISGKAAVRDTALTAPKAVARQMSLFDFI